MKFIRLVNTQEYAERVKVMIDCETVSRIYHFAWTVIWIKDIQVYLLTGVFQIFSKSCILHSMHLKEVVVSSRFSHVRVS